VGSRVSFRLRLKAHRAFLAIFVKQVLLSISWCSGEVQKEPTMHEGRNEKCHVARIRLKRSTCPNTRVSTSNQGHHP